jgi:hypothetical protein
VKAYGTRATVLCHGGESFSHKILQMIISMTHFFRLIVMTTMEIHKTNVVQTAASHPVALGQTSCVTLSPFTGQCTTSNAD